MQPPSLSPGTDLLPISVQASPSLLPRPLPTPVLHPTPQRSHTLDLHTSNYIIDSTGHPRAIDVPLLTAASSPVLASQTLAHVSMWEGNVAPGEFSVASSVSGMGGRNEGALKFGEYGTGREGGGGRGRYDLPYEDQPLSACPSDITPQLSLFPTHSLSLSRSLPLPAAPPAEPLPPLNPNFTPYLVPAATEERIKVPQHPSLLMTVPMTPLQLGAVGTVMGQEVRGAGNLLVGGGGGKKKVTGNTSYSSTSNGGEKNPLKMIPTSGGAGGQRWSIGSTAGMMNALGLTRRGSGVSDAGVGEEGKMLVHKPDGKSATFLVKLYQILKTPEYNHMIRWDTDGTQILIERPLELEKKVLPLVYKQSRFASFSRQLNIYAWQRRQSLRNVDKNIVDQDASTWTHATLNRNSTPEELANFKRRVPPRAQPPAPRKGSIVEGQVSPTSPYSAPLSTTKSLQGKHRKLTGALPMPRRISLVNQQANLPGPIVSPMYSPVFQSSRDSLFTPAAEGGAPMYHSAGPTTEEHRNLPWSMPLGNGANSKGRIGIGGALTPTTPLPASAPAGVTSFFHTKVDDDIYGSSFGSGNSIPVTGGMDGYGGATNQLAMLSRQASVEMSPSEVKLEQPMSGSYDPVQMPTDQNRWLGGMGRGSVSYSQRSFNGSMPGFASSVGYNNSFPNSNFPFTPSTQPYVPVYQGTTPQVSFNTPDFGKAPFSSFGGGSFTGSSALGLRRPSAAGGVLPFPGYVNPSHRLSDPWPSSLGLKTGMDGGKFGSPLRYLDPTTMAPGADSMHGEVDYSGGPKDTSMGTEKPGLDHARIDSQVKDEQSPVFHMDAEDDDSDSDSEESIVHDSLADDYLMTA